MNLHLQHSQGRTMFSGMLALRFLLFFHANPARAQVGQLPAQSAASDIERRSEAMLNQLTFEEKIDLLGGVDGFFIRGIPRLNIPKLKMADGPFGVRNYGPSTTMPGGIGLAATWNPVLAERVGTEIGRDARARSVHFLLGP